MKAQKLSSFTLQLADEVKTLTGFLSTEDNTGIYTVPLPDLSKVDRLQYRKELKAGSEESDAHIERLSKNLFQILGSSVPPIFLYRYTVDGVTTVELFDGNHTLDSVIQVYEDLEKRLSRSKKEDERTELTKKMQSLSIVKVVIVDGNDNKTGDKLASFAANRSLQSQLTTSERTTRFTNWLNSQSESKSIEIDTKGETNTVFPLSPSGIRGKAYTIRQLGELFNINHQTVVNKVKAFVEKGKEKKELTPRQKAKVELKKFQEGFEEKILKLLTLEIHEHETRNLRFVLSLVKDIDTKDELLKVLTEWKKSEKEEVKESTEE